MTTAETMIAALETALADNPGVVQVTVDGITVRYDRRQALAELARWKRKAGRYDGTRPTAATIKLDSF